MSVKVGLVSLGCAKNLIDSEIMIGHLAKAGMSMTADASEADVVIVNTCSFIDASKHEALEAIYEMSDGKATARKKGQKLIVAGCMSQCSLPCQPSFLLSCNTTLRVPTT